MHPAESDGTPELHTNPQAPVNEIFSERPRSYRVAVATNPVTRRRFSAGMYDYCLTPQYWEAF